MSTSPAPATVDGPIDADGHILEPGDLWEEHLEAKYRDRALRLRKNEDDLEYIELDGKPSWFLRPGLPGAFGAMGVEDITPRPDLTYGGSSCFGAMKADERITYMDREGLSKSVLYPSLALILGETKDAELFAAHCRAYNRWIVDFCAGSGGRLVPIAMVSLEGEATEAAAELDRSVKAGARGGFFLPSNWQRKSPGHPDFDPLWAKAQELAVPLAIHPSMEPAELDVHKRFAEIPAHGEYADASWYAAVLNTQGVIQTFVSLFHYGVFDRFPRVKFVVLESQATWIGFMLERMDSYFDGVLGFTAMTQQKPSDVFRRQCWISADPDEKLLAPVIEHVGADRFFWASDFPHPDHGPAYMSDLAKMVAPLSETSRRKILFENVTHAYGL